MTAVWYAGVAVVVAGAYVVSLIWHPYVPCRACRKTPGKHTDPVWRRAFGDCPACNGAARQPRLGVRLFLAAAYRRRELRGQRR